MPTTVDGRNPANQLRLVGYPIIYDGFYTSQVVVWDFFHQQYFLDFFLALQKDNRNLCFDNGILNIPGTLFGSAANSLS